MPRHAAALVALLLGLAFAACAKKLPPEARKDLPNGLRVIAQQAPGAPDGALVVLYDVGGDHDPAGRSGLAHLVEHLYVTAAAGPFPARAAEDLMASHPSGWNAQTGDRYTVVASVFPSAAVEAELDEAASRMGSLKIVEGDLAREKPRLLAELGNMYGRMPLLAATNLAREKARPAPRGGRRGGLDDQVRAVTVEEAQARWRSLYKPANAWLVLVSDLEPSAALARIEARFSAIPAGDRVEPPAPPGAASRGSSAVPSESGASACSALAVPLPGESGYPAALAFAASLLDPRAGTVTTRFAPLDDPGLLMVCAVPGPGGPAAGLSGHIEARVGTALNATRSHPGRRVREVLGAMLGTDPWPAAAASANPYGLAFSLGRRAQLGLDGAKLAAQLDALGSADVEAFGRRFLEERATVALGSP